eukprot:1157904-Pelagomonas_calceolata.AAC.5
MEGGDWSEVIDKQTTEAVGGPTPPPEPPTSSAAASSTATGDAASTTAGGQPIASPFARARVHRTVGENTQGATKALTLEAADQALNEVGLVRPYLIEDGGDVEVVNVEDGVVSLKLQVSATLKHTDVEQYARCGPFLLPKRGVLNVPVALGAPNLWRFNLAKELGSPRHGHPPNLPRRELYF